VWPGNLPGLYAFSGGILGYYIGDGGNDMYDDGNEIRVRVNGAWSGPLNYEQNCDGAAPVAVGGYFGQKEDATYITCKLPFDRRRGYDSSFGHAFVAIVMSPSGSIDGISTMGNLGADEGGKQEQGTMVGAKGVVGYYKKTYGANAPGVALADPSVNHIFFGQGIENAQVKIGSTTDSDLHELKFGHGVSLVYYVMWAGKEGYEYPKDDIQDILDRMSASCYSAEYTPHLSLGGGMNFGSVLGILVLVFAAIGLLVCVALVVKTPGMLANLSGKLKPGRSRTGPGSSSTVNVGNPPLQTPRMGLAGADSAQEYATAYTPPSSSM